MFFLPKTNPLHEHLSASSVNVPDILDKLSRGGFTGYVHHTAPRFDAYCIFSLGKLICAVSTANAKDHTGLEALSLMFEKLLGPEGEISIYRLSADLSMCAHALVVGTRLFNGDEVRQVNMKEVLARLKNQRLNGVVLFFAIQRHAMIFYKDGQPIGFYHDGASTINASPEESRKVAALPGAKLFIYSTKSIEELMLYDLLQLVNLDKLWSAAEARYAATRRTVGADKELTEKPGVPQNDILTGLSADLREVAMAYLSKEGGVMIEQQLEMAGGCTILTDSTSVSKLLEKIRMEALKIDSHARIDEMIELMKSEITGRLAI